MTVDYQQALKDKAAQRDALILAALPHVPFDGWSRKTLRAAAESSGFGADAADRLFAGGVKDAVAHFLDLADRLMVEDLKGVDMAALKIRARIAKAVRVRLERWTPHREAVRRALALSPLPSFAGDSLRGWYRTVDAMWRAAGDTSTDFNFYTKRGLLAGVYGATLLYWLDDRSEGCAATWDFLDRRIADVMQIPQLGGRLTARLKNLPDPKRIFGRLSGKMAGFRRPSNGG
jgi:ubiquinone biosynthesis protein COQ9